jgi:DNA-binding winged helix-turn-helix (wHTH) protein
MSQAELDRAVAERTGESIATIRRRGFSIVTPLTVYDPDDGDLAQPNVVDWDLVDAQRSARAA